MISSIDAVTIQTSSQSMPSVPSWFGEVTLVAQYCRHLGLLSALTEQVRFARSRFGQYDTIDFLAVLLGYAMSGERTLKAFYERVKPFPTEFMALFGRTRLPHRSTLSRFLEALEPTAVEALREFFFKALLSRPVEKGEQPGGLWDRQGTRWMVFDVDGTRQPSSAASLATDGGSSGSPAAHEPSLCPGLYGQQTGGSRANADGGVTSAHFSRPRHVLGSWQWRLTFGNWGEPKP